MTHLCLSGTPSCSGIAPCEACHSAIKEYVLPKAMVAGGFNGDAAQASAFLVTHQHAWRQLAEHIAALHLMPPTLNGADPAVAVQAEAMEYAPEPEPISPGEYRDAVKMSLGDFTDAKLLSIRAEPTCDRLAQEVIDEILLERGEQSAAPLVLDKDPDESGEQEPVKDEPERDLMEPMTKAALEKHMAEAEENRRLAELKLAEASFEKVEKVIEKASEDIALPEGSLVRLRKKSKTGPAPSSTGGTAGDEKKEVAT